MWDICDYIQENHSNEDESYFVTVPVTIYGIF